MNHVYRVIWNRSAACWQAVSETARGQSKSSKSSTKLLKPLLLAASMAVNGIAVAAPTGGAVTSGTASIGVSGSTTTINQSTAKAIINWNDFSIASGETVNFVQPDANAIALNRVVTATPSSIQGALNANGQVFIVNPNGITFGSTAQVNVGGLVASTLDITDTNFNNGTYRFNGSSSAGITNQGAIGVANTGTAALIAPSIQQAGSIISNDGTILLAAANNVTLNMSNRVLNTYTSTTGNHNASINHSAGLLQADGGKVILKAQGINGSSNAVLNSAGSIRAQTIGSNDRGIIELSTDMNTGVINLSGTLDASAPVAGYGGTVRTYAADVKVADSAAVSTRRVFQASLAVPSSSWFIKANSINVGSGGTISGSKLGSSLNNGNINLTASGTAAGLGHITINDAVSNADNRSLTLAAAGDININADISLTGNLGSLVLSHGTSNDYYLNNGSKINLTGANASFQMNGATYTVLHDIDQLQDMNANLAGNYVLGNDIDASATSGWNNGSGFNPIGQVGSIITITADSNAPGGYTFSETSVDTPFTGAFHGFGHQVSQLHIDRPFPAIDMSNPAGVYEGYSTGLFGATTNTIRDVHLLAANVIGGSNTGSLIGMQKSGTVAHVSAQADVSGLSNVGGLIGSSGYVDSNQVLQGSGSIVDAHATGALHLISPYGGSVYGTNFGGLVGLSYSLIKDSHATVNIQAPTDGRIYAAGGLVGELNNNDILNSYSDGALTGQLEMVGGLVGAFRYSQGNHKIYQSYATGDINASYNVGGLVGYMGWNGFYSDPQGDVNATGTIEQSYASGNVTGTSTLSYTSTGGLLGAGRDNIKIRSSYATGNVTGNANTGGLIGQLNNNATGTGNTGVVDDSYATGAVVGTDNTGGLIGYVQVDNTITNSYATGSVTGNNYVGGLIGSSGAIMSGNSASGNVTGNNYVGGLLGSLYGGGDWNGNLYGKLANSTAQGNVTGYDYVGGLAGSSYMGDISSSAASGSVTGHDNVGGLVGKLSGGYLTAGSHYYGWLGSVQDSSATGTLLQANNNVGGLVGNNTGTIERSYSLMSVEGSENVGGLVGYTVRYSSLIANNYVQGSVTGVNNVGGLIGFVKYDGAYSGGTGIYNNYSTAAVSGSSNTGGLVGLNQFWGDSVGFWDTTTSGQSTSAGGTGKTTAELKQIATFTGWDIADVSNTSSSSTWVIDENNSTPWLR
jgi:filamentous hemagglutinin family protein